MTGTTESKLIGEDELLLSRVFAAPRATVFKAWIDPDMLAQWWAPKDFTNPVCKVDARKGGRYHIVMRGPDGTDYPVDGTFLEIVPNEKIVLVDEVIEHPDEWFEQLNAYRNAPSDNKSLSMVLTVTFEDAGDGQTRLNILHRFGSTADREAILKMGHVEGFSQSLDKMEAMFEKMQENQK